MIKTFKFKTTISESEIDKTINKWIEKEKVEIIGLEITPVDCVDTRYIYYVIAYNK